MRKGKKDIEFRVGLFVTTGISLIMLAILLLGGVESFLSKQITYTARFTNVDGLIDGAKVTLNGIHVGIVKSVQFDTEKSNIQVTMLINEKSTNLIREDSEAQITTQGLLGDKFISINTSLTDSKILPPGTEIKTAPVKGISQIVSSGENAMDTLKSALHRMDNILKSFERDNRSEIFFHGISQSAKNLDGVTQKLDSQLNGLKLNSAINSLDSILKKIDSGKGTLGALINDPELYTDAKALVGGVNRNRIMRNLIRKTIKDSDQQSSEENKQQ